MKTSLQVLWFKFKHEFDNPIEVLEHFYYIPLSLKKNKVFIKAEKQSKTTFTLTKVNILQLWKYLGLTVQK